MNELITKVIDWAKARNLIEGSTIDKQFIKLMEESGELAAGIAKKNTKKVVDSIGDMLVVLTILAEQYDLTLEGCLASAYEEIKDRKGKMVDGVFVKEDDLHLIGG